ncbi:glutamate-cysteine ligase family protein [Anaerococcus vaginalis]|uniref:glutamate-cysteine ligase family protein n=1 Tax=Anaerococcus vaginalis TaxID=33037 RepID=UPI00290973FD|nr:glutamate-cysteine ligase family protein [Anaerococcus vaginalis]MDU5559824.1 glutamate-cysteine ligase family protein [Anaerococcus vaginalis]
MNYQEKKDKIVEYIKSGESQKENFKIGLEMEHFVIDKDELFSYDYFGEKGVGSTLKDLKDMGFSVTNEEDGYILGLRKEDIAVNLEPAGQFELAIDAKKNINDLDKSYKKIMGEIVPIFDEKNQYLETLGYHPKSKIMDLNIIPKDRYKYMQKYFTEFGGKYALNMMRGTASVQSAIDFSDEKDFKKKFFVANALSPFMYTLYDNAYIFQGKPYENKNLRQEIWEACDKNRTGVYDFAFDDDMSYEKYAEKILDTDIIFVHEDGQDVYKGNTKFEKIMDKDFSDEMIFHALSIVFPDVRVKKYIEIRMPDAVPYSYNLSFPALIKGLFYNEENLNKLREDFKNMTYDSCQKLKMDAKERGFDAKYEGKSICEWIKYFISLAKAGLSCEEKTYLSCIEKLIDEKETLRDKFEKIYKEDPKKACEQFSVNYVLGDINGKA